MRAPAMGARVQFCGHDATFIADIYRVEGANVVRAVGPVNDKTLNRPGVDATHHLVDFPSAGFWRPDLGVFVVPERQVTDLRLPKYRKGRARG